MKTVLQRQSGKYVLEFDEETIEEWGIDPRTALEVKVTGEVLTATPVAGESIDPGLETVLEDLAARYGQSLRKLAE